MAQTTVQHPETIRFGSARLEIGAALDSLVDVGACTGVKFTHDLGTKSSIKSDNAGVVVEKVGGQTAAVEANLMEINLDVLAQYLTGISKLETISGTEQSVTGEKHVLKGTQFVRLAKVMGDKTQVSNVVVKVGSTSAVLDTDYYLAVDADGYTAIARKGDSTVITDGATITVDYKYTPAATKRLSVGGLQRLDASVARLTNFNDQGQPFSITVYKASADTGIAIEFMADDAEETNTVPIKLLGTEDTTRAAGDQLFVIEDQQM